MTDYCAFTTGQTCLKWTDYQLTRQEFEEADELCHGNRIEIEHLRRYIDMLQKALKDNGLDVPPEY